MFFELLPLMIFMAFAGIGFAVASKGFWTWGTRKSALSLNQAIEGMREIEEMNRRRQEFEVASPGRYYGFDEVEETADGK